MQHRPITAGLDVARLVRATRDKGSIRHREVKLAMSTKRVVGRGMAEFGLEGKASGSSRRHWMKLVPSTPLGRDAAGLDVASPGQVKQGKRQSRCHGVKPAASTNRGKSVVGLGPARTDGAAPGSAGHGKARSLSMTRKTIDHPEHQELADASTRLAAIMARAAQSTSWTSLLMQAMAIDPVQLARVSHRD